MTTMLPFHSCAIADQLCYLSTVGALDKEFWVDKLLKAPMAEGVAARQQLGLQKLVKSLRISDIKIIIKNMKINVIENIIIKGRRCDRKAVTLA